MNEPNDRLIFEDYLQANSFNGIIERRNLSTGKFEYAFKHKTNILLNMDSIPTMNVVKKGRVDDMAIIDFEISLEFNTNSNFILEGPVLYNDSLEIDRDNSKFTYIDLSVDVETLREQEGPYRRRVMKKFICDVNLEIDSLPFDSFLDKDTNNYLKKHIKSVIYPNTDESIGELDKKIAFISLYENNTKLTEGVNYYIDWNTYTIYIIKPRENVTYHFGLYINMSLKNKDAKKQEEILITKINK